MILHTRKPTQKPSHPNRNTVCTNNLGTVSTICSLLSLSNKQSKRQKEFVQTAFIQVGDLIGVGCLPLTPLLATCSAIRSCKAISLRHSGRGGGGKMGARQGLFPGVVWGMQRDAPATSLRLQECAATLSARHCVAPQKSAGH